MKKQKKCPLCGSVDNVVIHKALIKDTYLALDNKRHSSNNYLRNYILFEFVLKRTVAEFHVNFKLCKSCGFIYFSPRPDNIDLQFKYDKIKNDNSTFLMEKARRFIDARQLRAKEIYRKVTPHIKKESGRILDIGGADGHCMSFFTNDYSCELLDFEVRNLMPGVKKIGETMSSLKESDVFDMILCCHTLEHIPDVSVFIKSMSKHLCEEGIIYLEVPFGCSKEIYKTFNFLTHINFFSEGSLGYLLNMNGLAVPYIYSGPTLSSKRYLPVIVAIAKKVNKKSNNQIFIQEGYSITKSQMNMNLDYQVIFKNIILVLSHPVQSFKAIVRKAGSGLFKFFLTF